MAPNSRMPPKRVALALWAERRFDPPPNMRTLRRWVEEGQLVPAPIKIGRTWYVTEETMHIAEAEQEMRLVRRLQRG